MRDLKRTGVMLTAFCALMTISARADATPITGGVTFSGVVFPTGFMTTDSINVVNEVASVTCAEMGVCDGSYAPLNLNFVNGTTLTATYNDFTFDPLPVGGYNPLWSFNYGGTAYAFNLLNITSIERSGYDILLQGTGLATISGYEDTAATWSFSADATNRFRFSATTNAGTDVAPTTPVAVPDAGQTGLLLGMAVVGLAVVRKRVSSGV